MAASTGKTKQASQKTKRLVKRILGNSGIEKRAQALFDLLAEIEDEFCSTAKRVPPQGGFVDAALGAANALCPKECSEYS